MGKAATRLTIDKELVKEAKRLKVNMSAAAQAGIEEAVRQRKIEEWKAKYKPGIEELNRWTEENGLWSDGLRMF